MSDILFGVFTVVWLVSRHLFYPLTCWSVYSDSSRLIKPACYRGTVGGLQGPLPVPQGTSHLLEPFRDPTGMVCWSDNIMLGFLAYLLILQCMMFIWSFSIVQVAVRVLRGKGADDIRSDAEEGDVEEGDEEGVVEEGDLEYEEAQLPEEEVGVEAIDSNEWKRRNGAKMVATSSGVRLSGHRDCKELLNRIGCDKQID